MSTKEREEFLQWHSSKSDETFDFHQEMLAYCRSDVDILCQACLKFRQQLLEVTGKQEYNTDGELMWVGAIDPFKYVTIASVCSAVYRCKFFKENWSIKVEKPSGFQQVESLMLPATKQGNEYSVHYNDQWIKVEYLPEDFIIRGRTFVSSPIAQVPKNGYDTFSKVSILWLKWVEYQLNKDREEVSPYITIKHALNGGEEKVITQGKIYKLDGYYLNSQNEKIALEFHGCIHHGCKKCYTNERQNITHPKTGQSMNELYTLTQIKREALEKAGYTYICKWECDFNKDIQSDTDLGEFVKNTDVQERLHPRDSFFGGRTNASKLHHKVQDGEKIKYVDFTSLYPWTNKYCKYPLGHPEVITGNFERIEEYFGIAKVKVLPPRGLYHPVCHIGQMEN